VNSIRARAEHVKKWLEAKNPDVLLIQELKGTEFPSAFFKELGYHSASVTQKTYNGVADVFEVENQCTTSFFFEQGPKRVNVVPCQPSTDAQYHEISSVYLALDFASHSERPGGVLLRSHLCSGNFLANRNVLKK
jgi:exonuclease III